MKCKRCGGAVGAAVVQDEPFPCGLPNVTRPARVRTCGACAERYVSFGNLEAVHAELAQTIARKSGRLAPEEIRFLRKYLGWSSSYFAKWFEVTLETVSRWENNHRQMTAGFEKMLKYLVIHNLERIGDDDPLGPSRTAMPTSTRASHLDLTLNFTVPGFIAFTGTNPQPRPQRVLAPTPAVRVLPVPNAIAEA